MNMTAVYDRVLRDSPISRSSIHGPRHWARVERNGLYLAEFVEADPTILRLFAVLHDSMRINENDDPLHGLRAADYAAALQVDTLDLSEADFEILQYAIRWHTEGNEIINWTVAVCWDADRLDLKRVGIVPDQKRLFTPEAKRIAQEDDYSALESYSPFGLATHRWA